MTGKYLLSIDGGGIRGIIPACLLVALEKQTGKPAREVFSFSAGTSTGAILTATIAAGVPATKTLDLYLKRATEVFPQHPWNILRRILVGSMYSARALRSVIAQELGPASEWSLNDAPIDVLLTAKRIDDGMPWYFVRDNPANLGRTGRLNLVDCATASAAAPTFFDPWTIHEPANQIPAGHREVGRLVDGGVGVAGNPVYQACVEAFYYTDRYQPAETTVVSLGTGHYLGQSPQPTWIWSWIEWILGDLLRSPGEQQTELVNRHFPDMPFYRLDPALEVPIDMDAVDKIDQLLMVGERFAAGVDWLAILDGSDTTFRIGGSNTLARQYARPAPAS